MLNVLIRIASISFPIHLLCHRQFHFGGGGGVGLVCVCRGGGGRHIVSPLSVRTSVPYVTQIVSVRYLERIGILD